MSVTGTYLRYLVKRVTVGHWSATAPSHATHAANAVAAQVFVKSKINNKIAYLQRAFILVSGYVKFIQKSIEILASYDYKCIAILLWFTEYTVLKLTLAPYVSPTYLFKSTQISDNRESDAIIVEYHVHMGREHSYFWYDDVHYTLKQA